ncbi:MAG TPA: hypothetical protein V6D31_00665 [Candidatus Sericytochromatia bacterium]
MIYFIELRVSTDWVSGKFDTLDRSYASITHHPICWDDGQA